MKTLISMYIYCPCYHSWHPSCSLCLLHFHPPSPPPFYFLLYLRIQKTNIGLFFTSGAETFTDEARATLEELVKNKILQVHTVAYEEDGVPYVQLFAVDQMLQQVN